MMARRMQTFGEQSPFYFHCSDKKLDKNQASQYYPPDKRMVLKAYLQKSHISLGRKSNYSNPTMQNNQIKASPVSRYLGLSPLTLGTRLKYLMEDNLQLQPLKSDKTISMAQTMSKKVRQRCLGLMFSAMYDTKREKSRHMNDLNPIKTDYQEKFKTTKQAKQIHLSSKLLYEHYRDKNQQPSKAVIRASPNDWSREPVKQNTTKYHFHEKPFEQLNKIEYPTHTDQRNKRNESSVSLKHDVKSFKEEEKQRKINIKWALSKNKSIQGQRSYTRHVNSEYPGFPRRNNLQSDSPFQANRLLDLNELKAQTMINREDKVKNIASHFLKARNIIKNIQKSKQETQEDSHLKIKQRQPNSTLLSNERQTKVIRLTKKPRLPLRDTPKSQLIGGTSFRQPADQQYRTTFQDSFQRNQLEQLSLSQPAQKQQARKTLPFVLQRDNRYSLQPKSSHDSLKATPQELYNVFLSSRVIAKPRSNIQIQTRNAAVDNYQSVYKDRYKQGVTSLQTLQDNNRHNLSCKKDQNENHFQFGGKLLVSSSVNGPMRLLDSEKRLTYFREKELSNEQNQMREKFKDKIERQNWNLRQSHLEKSRDESVSKMFQSFNSDSDLKREPVSGRHSGNITKSNFSLGYQSQLQESPSRTLKSFSRENASQLLSAKYQYKRNRNTKSSVVLGSDRQGQSSNYQTQYGWIVPKYEV